METDVRYPIGKYEIRPYSEAVKQEWLSDLKFLPNLLEASIANLDEHQLQTPYRAGGWTVHQLVHHVADSHMNAYVRFKLGFTEATPTIKPYDENAWVKTTDVENLPVNLSITLLFALHQRWHEFLRHFTDVAWERTVYHPEQRKEFTLWQLFGMYAWHGRHHVAHITSLRDRMRW
jgi:hypothetical protein